MITCCLTVLAALLLVPRTLVTFLALLVAHIIALMAALIGFIVVLPRLAAGLLVWVGVYTLAAAYGGVVGLEAVRKH